MGSIGQKVPTFSYYISKFWGAIKHGDYSLIHRTVHLKFVKRGDLKCPPHTR